MVYSFTGTQAGITNLQYIELDLTIEDRFSEITALNHGGCIGADAAFHDLLNEQSLLDLLTVWPASGVAPKKIAKLSGSGFKVHKPLPPLERNQLMVAECQVLIACPKEVNEQVRSGTWATVRRARAIGRKILYIFPDGETWEE